MIATPINPWPCGAAIGKRLRALMDVILHIGAHRTATTTFQKYMRSNTAAFGSQGVAFWGPLRTRRGLFHGLLPEPGRNHAKTAVRAAGRISMNCARLSIAGKRQLLVSDENIAGTMRVNLSKPSLYPEIGTRVALHAAAFGARLRRIVLSVRALDAYWASALAFAIPRGADWRGQGGLDRIVTQPRSWRPVIRDIARAAPHAEVLVFTHEGYAGRPERLAAHALESNCGLPSADRRIWRNRRPSRALLVEALTDRGVHCADLPAGDGLWQPFNGLQRAALRETYADDLFWLRAGADGLARLIEEPGPDMAGHNPPAGPYARGHDNGQQERGMVAAR